MRTTTCLLYCGALALVACSTTPAPTDAPVTPSDTPGADAPVTRMCPTTNVPDPDMQTLPCCYRDSQADTLSAPEMRLRYIEISSPAAPSPLGGSAVQDILNTALQEETFNWLFRTTGADADGPIDIVSGFGRRNAATGTYRFSAGMADPAMDPDTYLPITLTANLTGETVTSAPVTDALTVPIFDEAGLVVQIELVLHSVQILSTTLSESRSCIGSYVSRGNFDTAATLAGFIQVDEARMGTIMVAGISASLCGVVAGSITDAMYCETNPQSAWMVMPDSMCDAGGVCMRNGMGVTCDPATTCNAWYLEADFAAVGIDIE